MKNTIRLLSVLLCVTLLAFCVCRPMQVSAVEPVTITIGALGVLAEVLPYVAVGVLLLIACGYTIESFPQFIDDANRWVNSLPDLKEWALSVGTDIKEGQIVIIPEFVQEAMRKKAIEKNKNLPNVPYILLPPNFSQLDQATQEQLLNQQINTSIQHGNSLLTQIKSSITGFAGSVGNYFQSLGSSISDGFHNLKSRLEAWSATINANVVDMERDLELWFYTLNGSVVDVYQNSKAWFATLNGTISNKISNIKTELSTGFSSLTSSITSLPDKIASSITAFFNGNNGGYSGLPDNESVNYIINSGIDTIIPFVGSGSNYLVDYTTGFLAAGLLFNQFAEIPFIHKLLFVSATIGFIGVLLGIVINSAQADNIARKESRYKRKGG